MSKNILLCTEKTISTTQPSDTTAGQQMCQYMIQGLPSLTAATAIGSTKPKYLENIPVPLLKFSVGIAVLGISSYLNFQKFCPSIFGDNDQHQEIKYTICKTVPQKTYSSWAPQEEYDFVLELMGNKDANTD